MALAGSTVGIAAAVASGAVVYTAGRAAFEPGSPGTYPTGSIGGSLREAQSVNTDASLAERHRIVLGIRRAEAAAQSQQG